jgi:hypothetical protein
LQLIRDVLEVLKLPDIVPIGLIVNETCISRNDLLANINKMLDDKDKLDKYEKLMNHFTEIFPEYRFKNNSLTIKSILGKLKAIYKGFGAELKPNDNKHT